MLAALLGLAGSGRGLAMAAIALALGLGGGWIGCRGWEVRPLRQQLDRAEAARDQAVKQAATRAAELAQIRAEVEARNAEIEHQRATGLVRAHAAATAAEQARRRPPVPALPATVEALNRAWEQGQ